MRAEPRSRRGVCAESLSGDAADSREDFVPRLEAAGEWAEAFEVGQLRLDD